MIEWTSGWVATSSITSGIVSRVSPPAQSIGLFRLQRGGSFWSIAASRSSGRSSSTRSGSRVIASAVTTPQPPTVVSTTVFGPAGSGWVANEAAASNADSMLSARVSPAARHAPSNTLSSAARAPVWLAAASAPPAVEPPLTTTSGLRVGCAREAIHQPLAVGDALDVRESDCGGRVVGVEVEVVGDADRGSVAGRDGAADADARRAGVVQEARDEVARLAGDADRPLRRIRRDDLQAHVDRGADDALAVRPGEQDAEFVGQRDEIGLRLHAVLARFAVPGRGEERGLDPLCGAGAQQVGVGGRRGADEDEVDLAVGQRLDVGHRVDAEHVLALEIRPEDLARGSRWTAGCAATRTRTCRGGSTHR